MRTALRLLALLIGFVALPAVAVLVGNALGFTALECVQAALLTFPLSAVTTLIVRAAFVKARCTVAEVQES